jgi:hypothetical protein
LPSDIDSLVFESGTFSNWVHNPSQVLNDLEASESLPQYRSLLRVAKEKNIPIIFADLAYKNDMLALLDAMVLPSVEASAGFLLGIKALKNLSNDVSRRGLFRNAVALTAAAWLSVPVVAEIANGLSNKVNNGGGALTEVTAEADKFAQRLHPETNIFVGRIRNNVMTYKEQFLVEKHGYSHMVTSLGSNHVLIEDDIQKTPKENLAYLRSAQPLLKETVIPETFYSIVTNIYKDGRWESKTDVVPELRELVEQK